VQLCRWELSQNPYLGGKNFCCTSSFPLQSLLFASETHPAKTVLCLSPSSSQALNFWLSQTSCFSASRVLCSPPPGEAGISLVSIRIGHRNQRIPVMLIYRPLGCQHKYLINTDMNNTAWVYLVGINESPAGEQEETTARLCMQWRSLVCAPPPSQGRQGVLLQTVLLWHESNLPCSLFCKCQLGLADVYSSIQRNFAAVWGASDVNLEGLQGKCFCQPGVTAEGPVKWCYSSLSEDKPLLMGQFPPPV